MYLSRPMTWGHCKNISNDDNRLTNEYHFFMKKKHSIPPFNWLSLRGFKVSKINLQTLKICLSEVVSKSPRFESNKLSSRCRGRSWSSGAIHMVVYTTATVMETWHQKNKNQLCLLYLMTWIITVFNESVK